MKVKTYQVGWAVLGVLIGCILDVTIERVPVVRDTVFNLRLVTMILIVAVTFLLIRRALKPQQDEISNANHQSEYRDDVTRLLLPLLATMDEGILIVNSRLVIVLYNAASTRILRLPVEAGSQTGVGGHASDYGNNSPQPTLRLVDATRDPAINNAF
jgi:sensor histidine kinase regulating citrate/malate metabolism